MDRVRISAEGVGLELVEILVRDCRDGQLDHWLKIALVAGVTVSLVINAVQNELFKRGMMPLNLTRPADCYVR